VRLEKEALKDLNDDSGVQEFKDNKNIAGDRCSSWIDGRFLQGTFNGTRATNDLKPDVSCDGIGGIASLRSLYAGGVLNVALCDGSVRVMTPKTSAGTWKLLSGRNDGQVIPGDF
jgi:prepilin-type processing-associated H-X9-DG protein